MEALAARGNLAEATLAYDRLRTLLRDELGHDARAGARGPARPAAGRGGPRPSRPEPAPAALPGPLARAAERPFVARAGELERLRGAWAAARRGEARIVAARRRARHRQDQPRRPARARGPRATAARSCSAAATPRRSCPTSRSSRRCASSPTRRCASTPTILARVMPELASDGRAHPGAEDHATRYLLFDAVARTLESAAAPAAAVLVLEDLHWAEPPTLLLLRHVMRAAEGMPLLIVATYRTHRGRRHRAGRARSIASLERDLPLERIPLSRAGRRRGGGADPRARRAPVVAAARHRHAPATRPATRCSSASCCAISTSPGVLVERDGELTLTRGEADRRARERDASSWPRGWPGLEPETGVGAAGRRRDRPRLRATPWSRRSRSGRRRRARRARGRGRGSGCVEELGDSRHAFVHALVREAIYDGTGAGAARAMHAAVAEALEARRRRPRRARPPLPRRRRPGQGVRVLGRHGAPRDRPARLRGRRRPLPQRARGARATRTSARRCDLLLALADAHARAGRHPGLQARLPRGRRARRGRWRCPSSSREAAIGYGGRLIWEVSRDDPDLRALLERALERIGDATTAPARAAARPPRRRAAARRPRPHATAGDHRRGARDRAAARRPGDARLRARRLHLARTTHPTTRRARSS